METYRHKKGYSYEEYTLNNLLSKYDNVYFFKETPESVIAKTNLYYNYDAYCKYKNCDIGVDLVAIKNDKVYFIQCKNFDNTIGINDFCSFYFLVLEYDLEGIVYYNGTLSERLKDLSRGKIKYNNLPFNNTIIDVEFNTQKNIKISPRDYQLEIYHQFKNINKGIIALPCGMGKTYCSWLIGKDFNNIIIIAPSRSLAESNLVQLYNYSENNYNPILISMDGTRDLKYIYDIIKKKNIFSVTYDSVDILNDIIKELDNKIIFVDEYHNLSFNNLENKKDNIYKLITTLKTKIIFMSATPLLSEKYNKIFGETVYKYSWNKAIENKYICDFKIILPEDIKDNKIFEDFLTNIEYNVVDKDIILKIYYLIKGIKFYGNKKTIIYTTSIDDANKYSQIILWIQKMLKIDIETNIIDCKTSKIKRFEYIHNFVKDIKNQILINVQILNEGINLPECDSIFITKPNDNITNLIQRMCRCNRIMPNKKICFIYLWGSKKIINDISSYLKGIDNIITNKIEFLQINNITKNILIDKPVNNMIVNYNINIDSLFNYIKKNSSNQSDEWIKLCCENYFSNNDNFNIELGIISNQLNVRKDHLKKLLTSNFVKNTDYMEKKESGLKGRGLNNKISVLLNFNTVKILCMIAKCEKANLIRKFFVEFDKLIINYKENIG